MKSMFFFNWFIITGPGGEVGGKPPWLLTVITTDDIVNNKKDSQYREQNCLFSFGHVARIWL